MSGEPPPHDRRIALAAVPDFRLGPFEASPSRCEVRGPGGCERLEPRTMEVLVALKRADGRVVSREELIEVCWGGRIVSEDAVQRCIARLRRLFEADPEGAVAIETISKVGYVLVAEITEMGPPARPAKAARRPLPWRRWALVLAAAIATGALAAFAATRLPGLLDEPWELAWAGTVASSPEVELQPAISADGKATAYVINTVEGARIETLRDGERRRIAAEPGAQDMSPAWSPDGRSLAFVRSGPKGPCRLMLSRNGGAPVQAAACQGAPDSRVAWLGDEALVYSDASDPIEPLRLYALALKSGARRALTRPPADSHGDSLPTPDLKGGRVAFRRVTILGASDVYEVRLSDGRETRLTDDGAQIVGLAWAPGARRLVMTSGREGDYGLWSVDPAGGRPPRRLAVGGEEYGGLATDAAGDLLAQSRTGEINVLVLDHGRMSRPLPSTTWDWSPSLDPATGEIFYLSARDGFNEVWRARAGGTLKRLTSAKATLAFGLRRAPDGRRLAYAGVYGGKTNIGVLDLTSGRLKVVASAARDGGPPNWSADGRTLFYGLREPKGWRVWAVPAEGGEARPVTPYGWTTLGEDTDGRRYGLRDRVDGIWRLEPGAPTRVAADFNPAEWDNWSLAGGRIAYLAREGETALVYVLNLASGRRELAGRVGNVPWRSGMELLPDGRVVLAGGQKLDSDIVRFRMRR